MKYWGMNRDTGNAITDIEHISQSINDILNTPVGSRTMRRDYGSLLAQLLDTPANPAITLQLMSVTYSAIMRYEPRVTIKSMTITKSNANQGGRYVANLVCSRSDNDDVLTLSAQLGGKA